MFKKLSGQLLLAAAGGTLMFFAFPNDFSPTGFPPLAFFALVPLLFALEGATRPGRAAFIGFFFGLVTHPAQYHWLVYTMNTYGQMSVPVSVLVLIAMVLALSGFTAGFGLLYHLLRKNGLSPLLAAPVAWTALDFIRAHFPFGGFPWNFPANSQVSWLSLIQIAEFTGPYGITFVLLLVNAALLMTGERLYQMLRQPHSPNSNFKIQNSVFRALFPLGLAAGFMLVLVIYGLIRIPLVDRAFADQPEFTLGIVQGNVDQNEKWSQALQKTLDLHLELSGELMSGRPDLVIWPEAAVTVVNFNERWKHRHFDPDQVVNQLARVKAYFLVGSVSLERGATREDSRVFNSAYLLSPNAEHMLARYDKMRLVPFSEYVPLSKIFFFADAIAQGHAGSTTPGDKVAVMEMPGLRFGCVICYELVFPHLVRKFAREGAVFMTTITNDAWFGKTGAPYQHHSNAILRAIENRVFFARSANTGVSSIVDPVGRVLVATDIYTEAAVIGKVRPSPIKTFYARRGDVFAGLNLAGLGLALILGFIKSRREKPRGLQT